MNYQQILENIYQEIQPFAGIGKQADYIPALAKVDPDQFGICINTIQGETFMLGQADTRFSIQSISKVFSLAVCLSLEGDELWKRVGKEPQSVHQCRCHCIGRYTFKALSASRRRFPPLYP